MTREKQLKYIDEILKICRNKEPEEFQDVSRQYYHYTSISKLFSILEGDSFWASNVRFSNDEMEEKMLGEQEMAFRDDYVLCFCGKGDLLSQWRGYCNEGGASIELNINYPMDYSILHKDFDTTGKYELIKNTPIPVLYLKSPVNYNRKRTELERIIKQDDKYKDIQIQDMVPYLKNGSFWEEIESRMVFSNINNKISKCIRFRTLSDGEKVPYIVVKAGDIGKAKRSCEMDLSIYDDDTLKKHSERREPIWIEEGYNQETKYREMIKIVEKYQEDHKKDHPIRVLCRGHLPIGRIKVAPMIDRKRRMEVIKRFCMSNYWLEQVEVTVSEIPFVTSSF